MGLRKKYCRNSPCNTKKPPTLLDVYFSFLIASKFHLLPVVVPVFFSASPHPHWWGAPSLELIRANMKLLNWFRLNLPACVLSPIQAVAVDQAGRHSGRWKWILLFLPHTPSPRPFSWDCTGNKQPDQGRGLLGWEAGKLIGTGPFTWSLIYPAFNRLTSLLYCSRTQRPAREPFKCQCHQNFWNNPASRCCTELGLDVKSLHSLSPHIKHFYPYFLQFCHPATGSTQLGLCLHVWLGTNGKQLALAFLCSPNQTKATQCTQTLCAPTGTKEILCGAHMDSGTSRHMDFVVSSKSFLLFQGRFCYCFQERCW